MPFISPESVKEKRLRLKKAFPKFKFSVRTHNYSTIAVTVKSGPFQMLTHGLDQGYESVNHFHIKENYKDYPAVRKVLEAIQDIINSSNYIESVDGDYGSIPSFYTNLEIGSWDKHYEIKK